MGDSSDDKKTSIPVWQRKSTEPSPEPQSSPKEQGDKPEASSSSLLEQASRFLEDESIRDAPTDKKIAFLESKGLRNEDIQKLLGVSRNTEATANGEESPSTTVAQSNTEAEAPTAQSSQPQATAFPSSSSSPSTPSTSTRKDAPPIITYPEFLFKSPKPPPLITFRGVLYTLYGAAGLATGIYGLSQYVVTPMLETLSTARHDLAETAHENLRTLNSKLEQNVSTIPPPPTRGGKRSGAEEGDGDEESSDSDETDSAASDPTELFHRDIATQTTSSDFSSSTTTPTLTDTATKDPHETITSHTKRLQTISSHLSEFLTIENEASKNTTSGSNFQGRLSELQTYLTSLTYSSPSYLNSSLYGVYGGDAGLGNVGSGKPGDGGRATGMARAEEDAITAFKADIRGVKGALLSARNFPAGGVRVGSAAAR
ncbi:hypothetical protein FQN54_004144 [Arachnomyces sp. PD_36]|nr:hypothetical protein FQN54_004144 [Arachnomyces sp. PD_36]